MTRGRIRQESPKSAFDLLDESITLPPAEREATNMPPISECKCGADWLHHSPEELSRRSSPVLASTLASLLSIIHKRSERWEASKEKSQFDIRVKSLFADDVYVASRSSEFLLSSLDVYSSEDAESSYLSSRNDEPMTRGRDRQESAEIKGPVDMQSALSDCRISSSSPTDETAYKNSVSSECDVCSDPVPGIGESKTRGRVRRKKVKKNTLDLDLDLL